MGKLTTKGELAVTIAGETGAKVKPAPVSVESVLGLTLTLVIPLVTGVAAAEVTSRNVPETANKAERSRVRVNGLVIMVDRGNLLLQIYERRQIRSLEDAHLGSDGWACAGSGILLRCG